MSRRTLLRGGCVLALGSKTANAPEGDVLIDDGVVVEIGVGIRARDAEVVEAAGCIVMPGFVDTHAHVWRSLFKNLGDQASRLEAGHLGPDDLYAATRLGLLSALVTGTTTVVDWADAATEPALLEAVFQAHADSGLRSVVAHALGAGVAENAGPLTSVAHASTDVTRGGLEQTVGSWAEMRARGRRIHAHAGLDPAEGGAVVELAGRGALGADVTLVHGTHLSDEDIDALATHGVGLALAPSSEMAGGLGVSPLQKFLDRKIEPGLATDDIRLAPIDMLAQMRLANSIQHAAYFDLKLAGKAGLPNLLTTRNMIRYATVAGAQAVGLGGVVGTLDPGMRADLVVYRVDRPNIYPVNDPIGAIVWGVDPSNVDRVFVDGEPVVVDGRPAGDLQEVRRSAQEASDRLLAAAGIEVGV